MKEVNKGILDNDMVISAENVQKMGEVIALTCIKTVIVRSGKDLHYLYKGLLRDINRSKDDYSPFSNAYDIAQESMLFLCQHIGKRFGDTYTTTRGNIISIKQACFRFTDRYLDKQFTRHLTHTTAISDSVASSHITFIDDESDNDYIAVDTLIERMNLTQGEYDVLCAYMSGLTYLEVTQLLNVNRTTIWRRRTRIQEKFLCT